MTTKIDIYQRTLKCNTLDLEEDEIEILDVESNEAIEEEEQLAEQEEEKVDFEQMAKDFECMKRRIQKMQLKLKMHNLEQCPEEECVDLEVELNCSQNKEICALQKGHHRLQCQITELIRCFKFAKDQIKDLRIRMCQKSAEILELQKKVAHMESQRLKLQHEFDLCIERFEYLKHVKAEWADVQDMMDKQKVSFAKLEENFVPKSCFLRQKKLVCEEIASLKELFRDLFELQLKRYYEFEQRLNDPSIPSALLKLTPYNLTMTTEDMSDKKTEADTIDYNDNDKFSNKNLKS